MRLNGPKTSIKWETHPNTKEVAKERQGRDGGTKKTNRSTLPQFSATVPQTATNCLITPLRQLPRTATNYHCSPNCATNCLMKTAFPARRHSQGNPALIRRVRWGPFTPTGRHTPKSASTEKGSLWGRTISGIRTRTPARICAPAFLGKAA